MSALLKQKLDTGKKQFELLSARTSIANFDRFLLDLEQNIDRAEEELIKAFKNKTDIENKKFEALLGKLSALSPLAVFERGFCSAQKNGKTISSTRDVTVGDNITLRLTDGELECSVLERKMYDEI